MAIGIDELDFEDTTTLDNIDDLYEDIEEVPQQEEEPEQSFEKGDFVSALLRSGGIKDSSKIRYESENGLETEVDWNDLDVNEQLNIVNSLFSPETDLDDSEINLINYIRSSGLTPEEYLTHIAKTSVEHYASSTQVPNYNVDDYTDDELFVADMMGRLNLTQEEAIEALEKNKSNESLFNKLIESIRQEYRNIEDNNRQQQAMLLTQQVQQRYNQFAQRIGAEIMNFNQYPEFQSYDINIDNQDMDTLYEFITGFDPAGNSYLGKAINDPKTLTKMSWFALYGDQMLEDLSNYVKQSVREASRYAYNKGVLDSQNGNISDNTRSKMVYRPKNNKNLGTQTIDDLD